MTNELLIGRIRELISILQVTQNEFADRIKTDRSNTVRRCRCPHLPYGAMPPQERKFMILM